MILHSPLRTLLLSAITAVTGAVALVGLSPLSGTPSLAPPVQIPIAAPAPSAPPQGVEHLLRVHGDDAPGALELRGGPTGTTPTSGEIGCYGDGTSGPRVRAVYARAQSAPDRYAASLSSIRGWAAGVSSQLDASARRTGGRRHVRFATTPGRSCSVVVLHVVLPDSAFRTFRATIDALEARGLDAPSSKYLVWSEGSGYCGVATSYADDRPGLENLNNSSIPSYARVDRRCWGKVETHELVHMLGGVQPSARNSTGGFHCNDGHDVMCYDDGTSRSRQRAVCGQERLSLLDCRNDDYFSTSAPRGSYLQTHWNTARSSYLSAALSDPVAASSPRPASAAPSASPAPGGQGQSPALPSVLPTSLPTLVPAAPVVTELLDPVTRQVFRGAAAGRSATG